MKRNSGGSAADEAEKLRDEKRRHERLHYVLTDAHPELVAADSPTERVGGKTRQDLAKVPHSEGQLWELER